MILTELFNSKESSVDTLGVSDGSNNSRTIIAEALITQRLWSTAGRKLMEAQLTVDQINQIFQQIQQGATDAGGNRTMIGRGKDAATAVSKAWTDLKDKIYNSKPMTGFAKQYDIAAEKLKQATGGDAGAMKYIQKYRDFATKNPMLQSAIYAALIAASGISGVGIAGAAALGLFKLVDQALQGKDIRSAAWSGLKTGATAFAAGQIGQALKGQPAGADGLGGQVPPDMQNAIAADQAKMDWFQNKYSPYDGFTYQGSGDSLSVFDAAGNKVFSGDIPFQSLNAEQFAGLAQNGQNVATMVNQGAGVAGDAAAGITNAATNVAATGGRVARDAVLKGAMQAADEALQAGVVTDYNSMTDTIAEIMSRYEGTAPVSPQSLKTIEDMIRLKLQAGMAGGNGILQGGKAVAGAAANAMKESVTLSESQIFLVIGKIVERQRKLDEGIMDTIKGAAGKAVNYARTKGTNLTTKITADKLLQAWKKANSPTDSVEVYKVITGAGVPTQVAADVYSAMKIPMTAPKGGAGAFGAMSSQLRGGPQQAGAAPSVKPATAGANAFGGMAAQLGAAAPTAPAPATTAPAPATTAPKFERPINTGFLNPDTGQPYLPSELAAKRQKRTDAELAKAQQSADTTAAADTDTASPNNLNAVSATTTKPAATTVGQPSKVTYGKGFEKFMKPKTATQFPVFGTGTQSAYKTASSLPKPTVPSLTSSPAKVKPMAATTSGANKLNKNELDYINRINAKLPADKAVAETVKQVKHMLESVTTRDDVEKIKKYIDRQFTKHGLISELAFAQRNHLIERVVYIGAQRRREHARMS